MNSIFTLNLRLSFSSNFLEVEFGADIKILRMNSFHSRIVLWPKDKNFACNILPTI